jgi:hypothetical protein
MAAMYTLNEEEVKRNLRHENIRHVRPTSVELEWIKFKCTAGLQRLLPVGNNAVTPEFPSTCFNTECSFVSVST